MPLSTPLIPDHYLKMPHARPGMRIGLFGGSFNPPHAGHALVAELALDYLALDQLWWMVAPLNPLKKKEDIAPLSKRLWLPHTIRTNPKIHLTAFEYLLGSYQTIDTLFFIRKKNPEVFFIWIMGSDNLDNFHLWRDWQKICMNFPIAIINRPGSQNSFLSSALGKTFHFARIPESKASSLASMTPPAWTFIHGQLSNLSSTAIRKQIQSGLLRSYWHEGREDPS